MLSDSNLIIYATQPAYPGLREWMLVQRPAYSAISRVETLGYHRLTEEDREVIQGVLDPLDLIFPSAESFEIAVRLRQKRKMSLGDALIAATAIEHGLILATANVEDFRWIENLTVINPLAFP